MAICVLSQSLKAAPGRVGMVLFRGFGEIDGLTRLAEIRSCRRSFWDGRALRRVDGAIANTPDAITDPLKGMAIIKRSTFGISRVV